MKKATQAVQSSKDSGFLRFPRQLLAAEHWVSLTSGELVKITQSEKILWVWMYDRFQFFRGRGGEWFDNQENIASQSGMSLSTVKAFIHKLEKHGYLVIHKKKIRGFASSNSYVITRDLHLASVADTPCLSEPQEGQEPRVPMALVPSYDPDPEEPDWGLHG